MLNPGDRQLIWMSGQSWGGVAGTHRNMATAMTAYARILWVDPPVSPLTTIARRYDATRTVRPVLAEVTDRITRLTPVVLPGLSRLGIRATTPVLVRAQARWAVRRLGIRPSAVVMAYLGNLLGGWGDNVINVLYGTDDYVAGAELMGVSAGYLRARERRALARADIVTAITPQLAHRWAGLGTSPIIIPNGCWPSNGPTPSAPPEVADLPRPIIALVGQLSDRIDIDVLNGIADADFSLLLVGPCDPRWEQQRFHELTCRPRVRYVGAVPSASVRSYLAAADVGITPYCNTPFNRASFPLKTLEYLGSGLPVVTADLPAARWLRDDLMAETPEDIADQILVLAAGRADFVAAVRRMAASRSLANADRDLGRSDHLGPSPRCIAFAERHSWARRAEMLASAIGLLPLPSNDSR
jgi:teichuronic acid biosynthesis glycosyltransferase TuaH